MEANNFISPENLRLIAENRQRKESLHSNPRQFFPWWRPCPIKVLLVADGLDFGKGDFGLSTFVSILLNDRRSYVKFELTLAHIYNVSDAAVMKGAPGIVRSIKGFHFANANHFTPDMYDQVWLFGIEGSYSNGRLTTGELKNINAFMNQGGGVFATGDHGALGRALCSAIPRVRSMRLWNSTSGNNNQNEVSMNGARRNDTNRRGHNSSWEFDDQSDDIPQEIMPKLYTSRISSYQKEAYPHPLLCSHLGVIDVMPDHPHEGECHEPLDYNQMDLLGNREYPFAGTTLVRPELIARSSVPGGNGDGPGKALTQAHTFGSICVYDGHQTGVGRVVTDATWHHFVNVNLIGEEFEQDPVKGQGFLASPNGRANFDKIKEYYINIGVWLARTKQQKCFNTRLIWPLLDHHRVIEAAVLEPNLRLPEMSMHALYGIGTHATDVLGKKASQCRKLQFIFDIGQTIFPEYIFYLNPWLIEIEDLPEALPWVDPTPLVQVAIGAGIVALRDEIGALPAEIGEEMDDKIRSVFINGARHGARIGLKSFRNRLDLWSDLGLAEEGAFIVKGYVFDKAGKPLKGLTVTAADQDFSGENTLGKAATTDKGGYFEIPYQASDFIIDGKESGGADIILRFYRKDQLVKETAPYRNAESSLSVKVILEK